MGVAPRKKIYMFAEADVNWCSDVMHLVSINGHNSTIWPPEVNNKNMAKKTVIGILITLT
jgi:hypothetical protein